MQFLDCGGNQRKVVISQAFIILLRVVCSLYGKDPAQSVFLRSVAQKIAYLVCFGRLSFAYTVLSLIYIFADAKNGMGKFNQKEKSLVTTFKRYELTTTICQLNTETTDKKTRYYSNVNKAN